VAFTKAELKAIAGRIRKAQKDAMKALRSTEEGASESILALLRNLHNDITADLSAIQSDKFMAFHLKRIQSVVDSAIQNFKATAQAATISDTSKAMQITQRLWSDRLDVLQKLEVGPVGIVPVLSDESLAVIQSLSTELISGLADETAKKIKLELQKGVLGSASPFDIARAIEPVVGLRGGVGASAAADRIVRTEINRAFSMADEMFRRGAIEDRPEDAAPLVKIWATAGDDRVRDTHAEMDGLYVMAEDDFRVPLSGKGGKASSRTEPMTGPHDPKASAGNVVNCRCVLYTVPEYLADQFGGRPQ
jgi:hypothetical protein